MDNVVFTIRKSLQKRQEAMYRYIARKEAFLIRKEQTRKDIEEARKILANTMEQLPKNHFN